MSLYKPFTVNYIHFIYYIKWIPELNITNTLSATMPISKVAPPTSRYSPVPNGINTARESVMCSAVYGDSFGRSP